MSDEKKKLTVNCGVACLLNDREGALDKCDHVTINAGNIIVSKEIHAKLSAKKAMLNSGNLRIMDVKGEIIQLDKGAAIDESANLKGLFVIAMDNLLVKEDGVKALGEAEGIVSLGTVYYPQSAGMSSLAKVFGEKRPYPDGAHVILGEQKLEGLLSVIKENKKHIWVSGRITALNRKAFEHLRDAQCTVSCGKLFTYESLDEEFGNLINCPERSLVPDGYEITGRIRDGELGLYGSKLYVDGKFSMTEDDIPALEEIEAIIVKGKASLPSKAVKTFKGKGKAEQYYVFDGRLVEINGFQQFTHSQLEASAKKGEKLSLIVNGGLVFDEDVTAEDVECISSLTYNGSVMVSGAANAALTQKVKVGNGFMGTPEKFKEMTGKSVQELIGGTGGESNGSIVNLGSYILI